MGEIKQINVDNTVYDLKDEVARASIPFGRCNPTSTSTAFTATVPGITELYDGVCVMLENGVVTSASGFTLNVNELGAKPVYNSMATDTRDTTIFNAQYTMLFVYDEARVSGGCWVCYRGYDSNTNTIGYQLRTNATTKKARNIGYRYRLWFTSADGTMWVPANVSTSTNNTTARTANQEPIDPFGAIIYNSYNGTTNPGVELGAGVQWEQYTLPIGYSFTNSLPLTDNAPIYVQCAPLANGSAIMQGTVEALPTTRDGYIYIYLGQAYNTTNIELRPVHPVYYHDGTGIRLWTGGSSVYATQTLTSGTEIGSVTVDGVETKLYAPSGSDVSALTDTEIEEAVEEAFPAPPAPTWKTVQVSLTDPRNASSFGSCNIFEIDENSNPSPIGSISSASGSTEVTVNEDKMEVRCSGGGVHIYLDWITTTGGVTLLENSSTDSSAVFSVTGDGSITMDRVNWDW